MGRQSTRYPYFRDSPLNELAHNRPSHVMSRNSTSAIPFNPRCLRLTDGLSEFGLWPNQGIKLFADLAGERARPARSHLPHVNQRLSFLLQCRNARGILHESDDGEFAFLDGLIFRQASVRRIDSSDGGIFRPPASMRTKNCSPNTTAEIEIHCCASIRADRMTMFSIIARGRKAAAQWRTR